MFGIETYEIILLFKQLGIVIAGAAALWGAVFSRRDFSCGTRECIIYDWIAGKLTLLVFAGVALATIAIVFGQTFSVYAHEGIVLVPTLGEIQAALGILFPLMLVILCVTLIGFFFYTFNRRRFDAYMTEFLVLEFVLLFIASSLTGWTGSLGGEQIFFFVHGFHSIFTLGTVIVLDALFLLSERSRHLKQHIFPLFPMISKVIWIGLAFDFLSSLLVINQFEVTAKFLFMQTVIGILIINGVMLSGPITKKILSLLREGKELPQKWNTWASVAGTISITSWLTITVVDFFEHLTLDYVTLLLLYLLLITILFIGHEALERYEKRREAPRAVH
ncbi:MAG: hypothetical protein WDZ70_01295 [Candidatus Paceibacterota bacterium]